MIARMRRLACVAALAMSLMPMVAMPVPAQSPTPPTASRPAPDVIGEVSVIVVLLRRVDGTALTPDDLAATVAVMEARLAALPAPGTHLTPISDDRVRIDLGDPGQLEGIRRVATAPGELLFVPIPEPRFGDVVEGEPLPPSMETVPILDGVHVADAHVKTDEMGQPVLHLGLDAEGAELFDAHAGSHVGERLALVLDGIVVSAPTLNAPAYEGRLEISGPLDEPALSELVAILSGGMLPVVAEPLDVCPAPATCPVPSLPPAPTPSP